MGDRKEKLRLSVFLAVVLGTGEMRQIEGLTAADVWSYYCLHQDLVQIVDWIDTQFSPAETLAPGSVPRWPLTEPISSEMIAELHSCPARLADYLLDRLARYWSRIICVVV